MTEDDFEESLSNMLPPDGLAPPLTALWHTRRGEWDTAHGIVQDEPGRDAAWVHAHLHRIEGDRWNAGYWYRQAGKGPSSATLEEEWHEIVTALLG